MAIHNKARIVGYVRSDPMVIDPETSGVEMEESRAMIEVRTTHRKPIGYPGSSFQNIFVLCDANPKLLPKIKELKAGDFVDITGVYNVTYTDKESVCPVCGEKNIKQGINCFIYPLYIERIYPFLNGTDGEKEKDIRDEVLQKRYVEVSNECCIVGTVASDPERINGCTRYCIAIDRRYFILSQNNLRTDYPFIYSYGEQGERDYAYLQKGTLIMADCFIRNRKVKTTMTCDLCLEDYEYEDFATELIPYSIEYLRDQMTKEEALKKQQNLKYLEDEKVRSQIFG